MWPLNTNSFPQWFTGNQALNLPKPNSNFANPFAQPLQPQPLVQPKVQVNTGIANTTALPWGNDPFVSFIWPQTPVEDWATKGDYFSGITGIKSVATTSVDKNKEAGKGTLSGKGSIDGTRFKSGDGERYELKVESGKSYNLLSDVGIGLNGTYGKDSSGETVLTDIALSVGGKIVTLANDGTLRIDGKAFDKKKNNLEGLVTENKDGTYTVKANGYEFELKASESGIKVKIDAKNARTPEGLWGVALDGEKNTEKELQKSIKESDYKIDDALTFDYEDNNNIGDKYTPDLDDDKRNELAWNSRNPQLPREGWNLRMGMNVSKLGAVDSFVMHGPSNAVDDSKWTMDKLSAKKFYNVFSDEGVQVNGRFENGRPVDLGFIVDGEEVRVERTSSGMKVTVNGDVVTSYNAGGITLSNGNLKIVSDSDEAWSFEVSAGSNGGLSFFAESQNAGANDTRSTGLLGDTIRQNMGDIDARNVADKNGAGYLRNADGSLSKAGQDMTKALREYEVDGWDDIFSDRSVYE